MLEVGSILLVSCSGLVHRSQVVPLSDPQSEYHAPHLVAETQIKFLDSDRAEGALPTSNNALNARIYIHFINIYFRQHNYIIKA